MKREEAIQTLNVMQSSYAHIRHSDAEWEALEMAKEALNSQRMEPCMKCSSKCCFCLFNESRKCIRCKDHSFIHLCSIFARIVDTPWSRKTMLSWRSGWGLLKACLKLA